MVSWFNIKIKWLQNTFWNTQAWNTCYICISAAVLFFSLPQNFQSRLFKSKVNLMCRECVVLLCLPPYFILSLSQSSVSLSVHSAFFSFTFDEQGWSSSKQSQNKIRKHTLTPLMSPIHYLYIIPKHNHSLKVLLSWALFRSNYQTNDLPSISEVNY